MDTNNKYFVLLVGSFLLTSALIYSLLFTDMRHRMENMKERLQWDEGALLRMQAQESADYDVISYLGYKLEDNSKSVRWIKK